MYCPTNVGPNPQISEQNSHSPSGPGNKQFDQTGLVLGFLRQVHANICAIQKGHPACDDRLGTSSFRSGCGSMLCLLELLLSTLAPRLAAEHSLKEALHFCCCAGGEDGVTMETTKTMMRMVSTPLGQSCSFSLRGGQVSGDTSEGPPCANPLESLS